MLAVDEDADRQPVTDLYSYAQDCLRALAEALDRHGPQLRVRELAACRGTPIETFFPGRGQPLAEARSVCRACRVAMECRVWARGRGELLEGVWGGEAARERRRG